MTIEDVKNLKIPGDFDYYSIEKLTIQLDSTVKYFYGCSRFAIIFKDKVVKIPFELDEWGHQQNYEEYCEKECLTFQAASPIGLSRFFAEAQFGGMINEYTPYYIYERADPLSRNPRTPSKKSLNKAKKIYTDINPTWLAVCYDYYPEEKVNDFLVFLQERNINDLHKNNIGYRKDGSPCLIDYAGFS